MEKQPLKGDLLKNPVTNLVMALGLGALGVAIGAAGIYVGDTDDAPGAALLGILLMIGLVVLGVRTARRRTQHHSLARRQPSISRSCPPALP